MEEQLLESQRLSPARSFSQLFRLLSREVWQEEGLGVLKFQREKPMPDKES